MNALIKQINTQLDQHSDSDDPMSWAHFTHRQRVTACAGALAIIEVILMNGLGPGDAKDIVYEALQITKRQRQEDEK